MFQSPELFSYTNHHIFWDRGVQISDKCTVSSLLFFLTQSGLLCSCSAVIQDMVKGSLICQPNTSNPELITVTTDNIPLKKMFDANISAENFGVPSSRIFELCKFYHWYSLRACHIYQSQGFKEGFGGGGGLKLTLYL